MRRKSPRVVWLPQTNANSLGDGTQVYQLGVITVGGPSGATDTLEQPVVLDNQQTVTGSTDPSLSDIESSGYRLRRIVGKFWCECAQGTIDGSQVLEPSSAIVTAAFIVRKSTDFDGTSYASNTSQTQINTGLIDNTSDPWIWRRSWVLGNNNAAQLLNGVVPDLHSRQFFPTVNFGADAGSVADGPHIDQKTARIIGPEERLYLDVSVTILGEAPGQAGTITIAFFTDVRILGSLRTTSGNRRNASR